MSNEQVTATFFGATDTGRRRTNNEDTFIACELWGGSHLLLAAIDGIGGYEGGEVAAEIARDVIVKEVSEHPGDDCLELLKHAVTKANNAIVEHKETDPTRARMGCVISSAIISLDERRLYMVHVGDSRLYQYTVADGLKKLSHDHSLVGYREEIGMLTEQQAMTHPQRNIIERSLGDTRHSAEEPNFLDAGIFPIFGQTQFLLCSDGLSDMLYSAEIAAVLAKNSAAEDEVAELINQANDAGGKDNITVVIAKVDVPVENPRNGMEPDRSLSEPDDITTFGMPLPDADNSDDLIAPDYAAAPAPMPCPQPHSVKEQSSNQCHAAAPPANKRSGLKRFNTLVIVVAVSFLLGGTAGFFIGRASLDFPTDKQKTEEVAADSLVTVANDPDTAVANAQLAGKEVADSINKAVAGQIPKDTTLTKQPQHTQPQQ